MTLKGKHCFRAAEELKVTHFISWKCATVNGCGEETSQNNMTDVKQEKQPPHKKIRWNFYVEGRVPLNLKCITPCHVTCPDPAFTKHFVLDGSLYWIWKKVHFKRATVETKQKKANEWTVIFFVYYITRVRGAGIWKLCTAGKFVSRPPAPDTNGRVQQVRRLRRWYSRDRAINNEVGCKWILLWSYKVITTEEKMDSVTGQVDARRTQVSCFVCDVIAKPEKLST